MKLEILGSGGAVATPKPFCHCEACTEARAGGPSHTRWGPSVFIHGPEVLIDTPEEISPQLNRSTVSRIRACLYSHWHPDHTAGKRVFEMNKDWLGLPPQNKCTPIYITERIQETFQRYLSIGSHFEFLASEGLIDLKVVANQGWFALDEGRIRPVPMKADYSFGYHLEYESKNLLVVMDELKGWEPDAQTLATEFDLAYLPLGILDVNPLTGKRNLDPRHPILVAEQTVDETLDLVARLRARRFVLSHIEEPDGITVAMGQRLGEYYSARLGKEIHLAQDLEVFEV